LGRAGAVYGDTRGQNVEITAGQGGNITIAVGSDAIEGGAAALAAIPDAQEVAS